MILLTRGRYTNALGAWHETNSGPWWFGIVNVEHLFGVRNVFAHETGHAFSLNHNRESNGGDVPYEGTDWCNFGWRFLDQDDIERRTIMATIPNSDVMEGESQILNYSNPDVEYNGAPTGDQYNANANHMSGRMCEVDDYFEDEELEVVVNGPDFICNEWATYTADITNEPPTGQPGSAPFTFSWWKNNTVFFNILNGSGQPDEFMGNTQSIQFYSPANETFWLSVIVYGSGSVHANSVMKVESPCSGKPGGQKPKPFETTQSIKLFPNPAYDHVRLLFDSPVSGISEYALANSVGQIVASGKFEEYNINDFDVNLPNTLPSGVYQFTLRNGTFFGVQTLFVNR
jgi:hypothetical protein